VLGAVALGGGADRWDARRISFTGALVVALVAVGALLVGAVVGTLAWFALRVLDRLLERSTEDGEP
jgi:hypothetical protein